MSTIMSLHDALQPLGLSRPGQQVEGLKLPRFSTCQPLVLLQSFIGLEPLATSFARSLFSSVHAAAVLSQALHRRVSFLTEVATEYGLSPVDLISVTDHQTFISESKMAIITVYWVPLFLLLFFPLHQLFLHMLH